MKILNISLFIKQLSIKKNAKRYLAFINTGIFLSIFAITATIITFYTESKIDKLEFDLQLEHKYRKQSASYAKDISNLRNIYFLTLKNQSDLLDIYEENVYTKFGQATITVNDIYLPDIAIGIIESDKATFKSFYGENGLLNRIEELFIDTYEKDSWLIKDVTDIVRDLESFEYLIKKDRKEMYNKVFSYDLDYIVSELEDNLILNWNDPIYLEYLEITKFFKLFKDFFYLMEAHTINVAEGEQETINNLNKEILKLSNMESKIIFSAFILQLIVFFIIQFFEVTSIQKELKNYAKRKIK
jgi:hypothetical protein